MARPDPAFAEHCVTCQLGQPCKRQTENTPRPARELAVVDARAERGVSLARSFVWFCQVRIPVTVLTGVLGAGKTTLLRPCSQYLGAIWPRFFNLPQRNPKGTGPPFIVC